MTIYSSTTWITGIAYNRQFINKSSHYTKKALPAHKKDTKVKSTGKPHPKEGCGQARPQRPDRGSILKDNPSQLHPYTDPSTQVYWAHSHAFCQLWDDFLLEIGRTSGCGVGLSQIHKKIRRNSIEVAAEGAAT